MPSPSPPSPPDDTVFRLIAEDLDPQAFEQSPHLLRNKGAVKHHDLYMLRDDVLAASAHGELMPWCQYEGHDADKHRQRLAEVSVARIVDSYINRFDEFESLAHVYESMLSEVEQSNDPDLPGWIETKEQLRDFWERAVDMQTHVSQLRQIHGVKVVDHVDDATFDELTRCMDEYNDAKATIDPGRRRSMDSEEEAAVGLVNQEVLTLL